MFRRMLSGAAGHSDKDKDKANAADAAANSPGRERPSPRTAASHQGSGHVSPLRSPSLSRGSTPPLSPRNETDEATLASSYQAMNLTSPLLVSHPAAMSRSSARTAKMLAKMVLAKEVASLSRLCAIGMPRVSLKSRARSPTKVKMATPSRPPVRRFVI